MVLSGKIVGLGISGEDLEVGTKSRMRKILLLSAKAKGLKRLDGKLFVTTNALDSCVTKKTANIFGALLDNGKKMAAESFLFKKSSQWP
ncbi:hypothetical protein PR048_016618 [Dryococelus australis]|uniref:Uncharacterized protein n=1 Tax=Dryococelus australis TaxID=614101 RepID=A0ABQ9H786_9NEOP|nr:hypothetical protein PR048_016618 [Dryococelus australis]